MENYLLFVVVATITVMSPGPGVILTLTNSIRSGFLTAVSGILGIVAGTFLVAAVSATSLGLLLMTSSLAFNVMKVLGAVYLIYLGIKLWRSTASPIVAVTQQSNNTYFWKFFEGLSLQLTNPKAVFFFLSVFPQFISYQDHSAQQFSFLVITYSVLVLIIHLLYAYLAQSAQVWLGSSKGRKWVNRIGGGCFIGFGVGLATASK